MKGGLIIWKKKNVNVVLMVNAYIRGLKVSWIVMERKKTRINALQNSSTPPIQAPTSGLYFYNPVYFPENVYIIEYKRKRGLSSPSSAIRLPLMGGLSFCRIT